MGNKFKRIRDSLKFTLNDNPRDNRLYNFYMTQGHVIIDEFYADRFAYKIKSEIIWLELPVFGTNTETDRARYIFENNVSPELNTYAGSLGVRCTKITLKFGTQNDDITTFSYLIFLRECMAERPQVPPYVSSPSIRSSADDNDTQDEVKLKRMQKFK